MPTSDHDDVLDSGEWGVFVARVVQEVRRESGDAAAGQVASVLRDLRSEADVAARMQLSATHSMLERSLEEVAEARRQHERLQADVARMEAGVREAKAEAATLRSTAKDELTARRAEVDAFADAESHRIAAAWEEIRQQELEVAARRSQLLDLDEQAEKRLREVEAAEAELAESRYLVEQDRTTAQAVIDDGLEQLKTAEARLGAAEQAAAAADASAAEASAAAEAAEARQADAEAQAERAAAVAAKAVEDAVDKAASPDIDLVDLRDEIDLRLATLDERETELDEWETELVARARDLELRFMARPGTLPPAGRNASGWGRRPEDEGDDAPAADHAD